MVGRAVVARLIQLGLRPITIGRSPEAEIHLDLTSQEPPQPAGLSASALIHCAASFDGNSLSEARRTFATNTLGAFQILELMERLQCSTLVYAGTLSSDPLFERESKSDAYGISKWQSEMIFDWWSQRFHGSFCGVRFPQIWDVNGDCCRHQPWFGRIVAYASRGLDLRMPPSGGKRNFLFVEEAAEILCLATSRKLEGVFAASHPESVDMADLATKAYECFGRGGRVSVDESKLPFRELNFPSGTTFFEKLGFVPRVSATDGFEMIKKSGTASRFGPMDVL